MRTKRVRDTDLEFLAVLAGMDGIRIGPYGQRIVLRRWASAVTSPIRFARQGLTAHGLVQAALWAPLGYQALLLERRMAKFNAVTAVDGHAGLVLHRARDKPDWCWQISSFWAWPTGHGYGLPVLTAVTSAADATGTVLRLRAGNQRLARDYYTRLGFVLREGQQDAVRPWILRPATSRAHQDSAPMAGVGSASPA